MARKVSLEELRRQLVFAEGRVLDSEWVVRMEAREQVKRLKARIKRRERDEALRSIGMKKVRGALGGTYWE